MTETRTVEVPVEVYRALPETIVEPVPYPPALPERFTADDLIDQVYALYDALDQANADKARAGEITRRVGSEATEVPR